MPTASNQNSSRLQRDLKKAWSFVEKANYKAALNHAEQLLKKYPESFKVKVFHTAILGDYADLTKPKNAKSLRKKSIKLMRKLLSQARWHQKEPILFNLKNEYYWQTGQHKKQHDLGARELKEIGWHAYYSQGVGAAWHAYGLAKKKQLKRALTWAKKSIRAWQKYNKKDPNYYNQFVHWALAYGVLGKLEKMEDMLKQAAFKSKRPITFREFEEIRDLVRKII